MESKNNEHWKDILTREWKKDFSSLTSDEVNLILQNFFYQVFMIDVDGIRITSHINESGHRLKFEIVGEAYRDIDNLPNYLLDNVIYEDEDDEE